MDRTIAPASVRWASALVIGAAIFISSALPSQADNSTNIENVSSVEVESVGTETQSGGGVAVAGSAHARARAIVVQRNIQVDPFNAGTQTATNEANIDQFAGAASGDATGTNGGVARSGQAHATAMAVVVQVNVQVITCRPGTGTITQDAANTANVDQQVLAGSGNASADGSGATAQTGRASARSVARINQRNIQVEHC